MRCLGKSCCHLRKRPQIAAFFYAELIASDVTRQLPTLSPELDCLWAIGVYASVLHKQLIHRLFGFLNELTVDLILIYLEISKKSVLLMLWPIYKIFLNSDV